MNDSPGALELLSERVDNLERRVRALEDPAGLIASEHLEQVRIEPEIETAPELAAGRLFPLIGRAMLGIAGAYVLRAIAEAGVVPKLPISAFAVAYAFGWLVWSTRVSSSV